MEQIGRFRLLLLITVLLIVLLILPAYAGQTDVSPVAGAIFAGEPQLDMAGMYCLNPDLELGPVDLGDIELAGPPAAPENLKVEFHPVLPQSLLITWEDKASNEDGFALEFITPSGGDWRAVAFGPTTSSIKNVTMAAQVGKYRFRVRAYNDYGYSEIEGPVDFEVFEGIPFDPGLIDAIDPGEIDVIDPFFSQVKAPSDLVADVDSSGKVKLAWQDNSDNEAGFKIERKTGSGSFSEIGSVGAGVEEYSDDTVAEGKDYQYRVKAFNIFADSAYSNTQSVNVPAAAEEEEEAVEEEEEEVEEEEPATGPSVNLRFVIDTKSFEWNGVSQQMDVAPIIRESRTLLPIRYVADPLGAQVNWNPIEGKVTIKSSSKTIELWINNNTAKVNGTNVRIDAANGNVTPVIIPPGRTMLPLRFIADNLDCNVIWNKTDRSITVSYPK